MNALASEFVHQALAHIEETGEPLLRHLSVVEYHTTLAAWGDAEYGYRLTCSDWEPPFTTWRELMVWTGSDERRFLEKHDLEAEELDREIPDPSEHTPDRCTAAGVAFTVLEDLRVPRTFWTPILAFQLAHGGHEVDEEDFGEIVFGDSAYVGNEETVVMVTTALALSCLQEHLNAVKAGVRVVLAG